MIYLKYICNQDKTILINLYNISHIFVSELSVYLKTSDKKIKLGTFNTKEDAKNEFINIKDNLSNSSIFVYQVNTEEYWVKKRIENELRDLFKSDPDEVEKDSNLLDIINTRTTKDIDEDEDAAYIKDEEDELEAEEEEEVDFDDYDDSDNIDSE